MTHIDREGDTTMTVTRTDRGSTDSTTIYSEGGDLVFERIFDAPRDLVWRAFMEPAMVERWWGPLGTSTTVAEMDVRPGGTWRYVSRASDREDVTFFGEYLEIDPPERFRWTFLFDVEGYGVQGGPETFTFEDVAGKTKVTTTSQMGSAEAVDGALASGMTKGAIETWDRLDALLAEGS